MTSLEIMGHFANGIGIISGGISLSIWLWLKRKERFDETRIEIILVTENKPSVPLLCQIERKHLTRSEVQGLIGALPTKDQQRYTVEYFHSQEFFDNLTLAQDKQEHTRLEIKCTDKEREQFLI